ncbi:MAG: hypothetical protein KJ040_03900, partial [Gammaproteobacteria bacterium]|nr:hypothetical protein [Gammaproteobacteria bacterium]
QPLHLVALLSLIAFALLMLLNPLARLFAVGALTIVYPFSKRLLSAPQFLLGAAFGWGIPMAFAAETEACPRAFRANQYFGAAIFAGILLNHTVRSVA